jgi:hypothetical protein
LLLIESDLPGHATRPGDSGSPVVTRKSGGMLLGMHIAGDNADSSLMIPAWFLFSRSTYPSLKKGKPLRWRNW